MSACAQKGTKSSIDFQDFSAKMCQLIIARAVRWIGGALVVSTGNKRGTRGEEHARTVEAAAHSG